MRRYNRDLIGGVVGAGGLFAFDGGLALLPPLLAIGVALVTKRVLMALGIGVLAGGWVAAHGAVLDAAARILAYTTEAVTTVDNLIIAGFTLAVAGMVAVMAVTGATVQMVAGVERLAKGPRGAMLASWLAGFVVFFDDYANCMVVGKAMGPVCDRQGVSRAKLAYIVDSTAAPVASLTLVSTWVGYEVGLLDKALATVGREGEGFALFLSALPFRFYGIFALALVGLVAWTGRDVGPMVAVEREARAARPAAVDPVAVTFGSVVWAALPVVLLVVSTLTAMIVTGLHAMDLGIDGLGGVPIYEVLGEAKVFPAMMLGSLVGWGTAIAQGLGAHGASPLLNASVAGFHTVLEALTVLFLAWSLGNAIGDTAAQDVLAGLLVDWLPGEALPTVVFVLAAFTAFSTGTSFGTMSILVPLAVPLAVELGGDNAAILSGTTAAVLAGACLGDHASPISDTTVLSAAGCQVDLVTHVRTQLPYALMAGLAAILVGYVPSAFGVPVVLCLVGGVVTLWAALRTFGVQVDAPAAG